ncbi:hypothetical protein F511_31952 [Dorcoceras hygrometricum]|uniref:Uncharacterized protein n=1 Tax=Dorcoceras hygrometricum TaxID=472368 RepID=A0A2Z7AE75_9LAMI|nr:hypothetical protein F511_31952 [Dorcoceras hygrometricum]
MPPRRRGGARRQNPIESEGQNEEMERSIPVHRHARQVDDEVDVLAARVDEMELIMARPRVQQFKKKSGSSSFGSGTSSSSSPRATFYGQCGGRHPSTQCTGVQGVFNLCGQYGHFVPVCPLARSQHTAAPPQGRSGGSSRGRSFHVQQQRMGKTQHRLFQQPRPSCFGQSSQPHFSGPQQAQVNAMTKEQAEGTTCVTLNGSGIQLAVGPQPLWLRNHNFGLAQRIMVKRLATSPHDPLGITDSACKNQLVVVSVQYGPFYTYIPIRSTIIGKSRVAIDPITMHTSWRSNSDIASVTSIGYPRMRASGESSTTKHQLLHASGPHPIPPPNDPKTNQYNQYLGLIHSTNGNHLESPNEGSLIDHQITIHLHAQNITMFPTNETWYFTSQMLVSSSGGLILILTVQSTRNEFRMHSDY